MTDRFTEFLQSLVADTYPEPPSPIHEEITGKVLPGVVVQAQVSAQVGKAIRVLDVGCGQGVALKRFKELGCDALGVTPNQTDYQEAMRTGCPVVPCDMHDLSALDHLGWDLIWARHVLEHSPAPLFALREFSRVLKPGGWLYVEVPMPDTACHHEQNKNHYSVLTDSMWQALIQKAGFTLVEGKVWRFVTGEGPDEYRSYLCRK
jgi:SAM-dependent methyltransferase